ncbi:hypothetical protein K6L05_03635 [Salinicoccus roseus]|nr:hypothetical protein [Salinicoccus roseus]
MNTSVDNGDLKNLTALPDYCPVCKTSLNPEYILIYEKNYSTKELLCRCTSNKCQSLFFIVYKRYRASHGWSENFTLSKHYPRSKSIKEFPEEINQVSPQFTEIYNQAHHAEQEELNLICGGAYRKSLELLIKDYIIKENLGEEEEVKSITSIQRCINKYIDHPNIKKMAERATWLGNDETHYTRQWVDRDIEDLKNLIDLTVYFISMETKAKKYTEEMDR